MDLTQLLLPDRINVVFTSRDITLLYDLLVKLTGRPRIDLMATYNLDGDFIMNRFIVTGDYVEMYNLFELLTKVGMEFESITPTSLRMDISKFIQTVR